MCSKGLRYATTKGMKRWRKTNRTATTRHRKEFVVRWGWKAFCIRETVDVQGSWSWKWECWNKQLKLCIVNEENVSNFVIVHSCSISIKMKINQRQKNLPVLESSSLFEHETNNEKLCDVPRHWEAACRGRPLSAPLRHPAGTRFCRGCRNLNG